jgi:ATP adenylyltransferase
MKCLWSPWRMEYLSRDSQAGPCIFCEKMGSLHEHDKDNLVLYRGKQAAVLMNLYPYNNGHLMVIPYQHVPSTELLSPTAQLEVMELINLSMAALRHVMSPHGFNVGINMGKAAGAGIDEHVHVHIVPRWVSDTNFLQICAQTRVIPEMLGDTYVKLAEALASCEPAGRAAAES